MTRPSRIPDWQQAWPFARDVILFVCGIAGIAHQTLVVKEPNPSLLVLFAGMTGLPVVLRKDSS